MESVVSVVMFAFLIETAVELLKPIIHRLDGVGNLLGVDMGYLFSWILAVSGAIAFRVDALPMFGIEHSGVIRYALTGLLASGGSNYVHNKLRHIADITVEEVFVPDEEDE